MLGNDEEENGSEDDEEYIPSDPEDAEDNEENESGRSSDDNDDDELVKSDSTRARQELKEMNKSEETEDERQQRLKSLFDEFIEGNDAKPKSSAWEALPASTAVVGKRVSRTTHEIPKLTAETADDVFGGISDKRNVPLKNKSEFCRREQKSSGLVQNEKRKAPNGLASAISALSKKAKVSVLEKTAQDWGAFKNETGIEEELTNHNRGKQGYVDRVEFLSRTDYRQFEIERDARNAARKKK